MGADGTPTTEIDIAAEDAIMEVLKADGRSMKILSEELGELVIGKSPEFALVLDPLDGTYNASSGIPFYNVSIAVASPVREPGTPFALPRGSPLAGTSGLSEIRP